MEEMGEDWDNCCPLCMEEMDSTDRQLKPCRCGYQICVWCWNHIMEMAEKDSTEGRCPACRTPYDKEKIVSTAISRDRLGDINDRKQKPGKAKLKAVEGRKNLSNVRVIQRNLVYVVGIPISLADEETLERKEYFGQYGKILKISVSKNNTHSSQHSSSSGGPTVSVYVTYVKEEDALRCIQAVNGCILDGKILKACFGTTKYCNAWLKHMPCNNPECLYLHDEGTREDSFTKEEMLANKSQHFHELTHPPHRRAAVGLPPPVDIGSVTSTSHTPMPGSTKTSTTMTTVGSLPKSSSLPAAASWGSRSNTSSSRLTPTKNSSTVAPVKLKTGPGPITPVAPLSTPSVSSSMSQMMQSQPVNNVDGTKHSKNLSIDDAQSSLTSRAKRLERTNSGAESSSITAENSSTTSDTPIQSEIELSRPGSSKSTSHTRSRSNTENNLASNKEEPKSTETLHSTPDKHMFTKDGTTILVNSNIPSISSQENPSSMLINKSSEKQAQEPEESQVQRENDEIKTDTPNRPSKEQIKLFKLDSDTTVNLESERNTETVDMSTGPKIDSSFSPLPLNLSHNHVGTSYESKQKSPTVGGLSAIMKEDPSSTRMIVNPLEKHVTHLVNERDLYSEDPWLGAASEIVNSVSSQDPKFYTQDTSDRLPLISTPGKDLPETSVNGRTEDELISDIFSTEFDLWTDGNPQDLAKLLFNGKSADPPTQTRLREPLPTWKSSGSNQSRFQFARQEEASEGVCQPISADRNSWNESQGVFSNSISANFGVSSVEALPTKAGLSETLAKPSSTSKHMISAPPGFSAIRVASVPPGFSQPSRPPDSRIVTEPSQDGNRTMTLQNVYNHHESTNPTSDVEFIDPAIMAVGRGKLPTGMRSATSFSGSPSLSGYLPQSGPLLQQPRHVDFDSGYQHQERTYRNYDHMNSASQIGYSNQDLDVSLSSLFQSSFNDSLNQQRFPGQYRDAILPHVMQDSLYNNGSAKLRYQHGPSWDEWNRLQEVNTVSQQSVNDAVGRLAMSHMSFDRVIQNRLEELALSKEIGSKYYGDASSHDESGPFSSGRIGRYFLQN